MYLKSEKCVNVKIDQTVWGSIDNQDVHKIAILDQESGFKVEISDLGATLVSVHVPDREGNIGNIIYGHNDPETYLNTPGYLGAAIGRVANRIQNAQFELEGHTYKVTANHKVVHQLHGGIKGFDKQIWSILREETGIFNGEARISLEYISEDGEEGFPGKLTTKLTYRVKPMLIEWEFCATTDKTTILNLTNHAYWNLNGVHSVIDDLDFTLYSHQYCVVDSYLIPTGEIKEFPINLTKSAKFHTVFSTFGDVDHNFFLDNYESKNPNADVFPAATLYSSKTGRKMVVETSLPCIQVYTGNFMKDIKSYGTQCEKHGAVCLETQKVPNAINMKEFRDSVILKPGEEYKQRTRHTFEIKKRNLKNE